MPNRAKQQLLHDPANLGSCVIHASMHCTFPPTEPEWCTGALACDRESQLLADQVNLDIDED